MLIDGKEYKEILVLQGEELLASITDENIIEHKDIKIVCVPEN